MSVHSRAAPRWLEVYLEQISEARGNPARLKRVFERSSVPTVMVDSQRRYLDANTPAQSALMLSVTELRRRRVDDLTPSHLLPTLESNWARFMQQGWIASPFPSSEVDRSYLGIIYYALANALPGQHVIAFAPAARPGGDTRGGLERPNSASASRLTRREVEVLKLAAEGNSRRMIARMLQVSPATVRTHFEHIYAKLGVHDRAAAVAQAMRRGVIE